MTDPGVSTCKEGCYNDQFDCTYNCPCYKNCPLGCPCDTYPNCPDVTTTTKKTTTTSIWYPTSSTTIVRIENSLFSDAKCRDMFSISVLILVSDDNSWRKYCV